MADFPFFGSNQNFDDFKQDVTLIDLDGDQDICPTYQFRCLNCAGGVDRVFPFRSPFPAMVSNKEVTEKPGPSGIPLFTKTVMHKVFSVEVFMEDYVQNALEDAFTEATTVKLKNIETSSEYTLFSITTELIDPNAEVLQMRISFECLEYPPITNTECCASAFGDAGEYDPPGGGGGMGDPCAGITTTMTPAGGLLTLDVVGADTVTSIWRRNGAIIGLNLTSVPTVIFGVYSVSVSADGCARELSYDNVDPCIGFGVSITRDEDELTAVVPDGFIDIDYTWEFSEDGTSWAGYDTGTSTVMADIGFYRVTVETEHCEASAIFELTEAPVCDYTLEIDYLEGVIAVIADPLVPVVGDYTYQWSVDTGDGLEEIDGATESTYAPTVSGYYMVVVTLDTCEVPAYKYVEVPGNECIGFTASVSNAGDVITATVSGCQTPTYKYFKVDAEGNKNQYPVMINEFTLPEDGIYYAIICCGDCPPKRFLIFKAGGDIQIIDDAFYTKGGWSL